MDSSTHQKIVDTLDFVKEGSVEIAKDIRAVSSVIKVVNLYQAYRLKKWWDSVVKNVELGSPEQTLERIENRFFNLKEGDGSRKVITENYRAMMDAVDDAAVPTLALIAAEYLAQN